jgi:hypothetical protein
MSEFPLVTCHFYHKKYFYSCKAFYLGYAHVSNNFLLHMPTQKKYAIDKDSFLGILICF